MRKREHSYAWLWPGVILAAVAAVGILGWLQFSWISQVSDAEQERMRGHLAAAARRISQEFNGTVNRAFRLLLAGGAGPPELELRELALRHQRWLELDPEPGLVKELYVTRSEAGGRGQLFRFDSRSRELAPASWPARLERLGARLQSPQALPPRLFQHLAEEIPALVAPRVRPPRLERGDTPAGRRPGPAIAGWIILELDSEYLRTRLLPELLSRHLPRAGDLDYQAQVVSRRDPSRVFYVSEEGLPADFFDRPDIVVPLMDLGVEGAPFAGRRLAAPPGPAEPGDPPGPRGHWLLRLRNRGGSLEQVVGRTRWRNLSVSFATLLLLSAGLGVLLVATRRMHRLAAQQMEFVAGVSHELRTPLSVICAAGDNLADGLISGEQQVRRYGSVVRAEGRRLTHMVEQILGFAGIQSGKARYEFQAVPAAEAVRRALAACQPEIASSGCLVEVKVPEDLPELRADPFALTECLRNLIENAARHGTQGGWIGVEASAVRNGDTPWVEIRVQDHGAGIPAAELPHLFEPFFRGRRAMGEQVRGFGLGLALVKGIVREHGGSIAVESEPGKGACFAVRLPALSSNEADGGKEDPVG